MLTLNAKLRAIYKEVSNQLDNRLNGTAKEDKGRICTIRWLRTEYDINIKESKRIIDYHLEADKRDENAETANRLRAALFEVETIARQLSESKDTEVLDVASRLADICEAAKGGDSEISIVKSQVDQLANEQAMLATSLSSLIERMGKLDLSIGNTVKLQGTDVIDKLDDLDTRMDELESADFGSQIDDLESELKKADSDLESSVEDVTRDVSSAQSAIDDLTNTTSDLSNVVADLAGDVKNLESQTE